jgi:drug/metabolite transporter (DMT)-like permease
MQLPWWGWTLLSVGGFAGTALISARLASAQVRPITINVYLFAVGLVAFLLYAGLTKADFRLPPSQCWWLLPLAGTLFASNYSLVTAYQAAPNVGYVKAIGVAELVLVALVVAALALVQGRPVGLPWWKLAGIGLCVMGAVLVALEDRNSSPAPQPAVAAASQLPSSSAPRAPAVPRRARRRQPCRSWPRPAPRAASKWSKW